MISFSLFRNSTTEEFAPGDTIFAEGERGEFMYFVAEGEVDIVVASTVAETVQSGGIFGEMALIDHEPRSASARARTWCRLAPVDEKRFQFLVSQTPFFALQVMSIMAERLRRANAALAKSQANS